VFFDDIDVGLWPIIIISEGMPIGGIRTKQGSQIRQLGAHGSRWQVEHRPAVLGGIV
jgi:hypothetical protein